MNVNISLMYRVKPLSTSWSIVYNIGYECAVGMYLFWYAVLCISCGHVLIEEIRGARSVELSPHACNSMERMRTWSLRALKYSMTSIDCNSNILVCFMKKFINTTCANSSRKAGSKVDEEWHEKKFLE